MAMFFLDWQLWQEMSFVLACCIVIVFLAGTTKLWRINRLMRRHELLDDEKRERISEMLHCGIDPRRADAVPFGVRALQSGTTIEGIWISQPAANNLSQAASSDTFTNERQGVAKGVSKWSFPESDEATLRHAFERTTNRPTGERKAHPGNARPVPSGLGRSYHAHVRAASLPDPQTKNIYASPYGSTELATQASAGRDISHPDASILRADWMGQAGHSGGVSTPETPSNVGSWPYFNRGARTPNKNLEMRPAGPLGPRQELSNAKHSGQGEAVPLPYFRPGPAKLRKKHQPRPDGNT